MQELSYSFHIGNDKNKSKRFKTSNEKQKCKR